MKLAIIQKALRFGSLVLMGTLMSCQLAVFPWQNGSGDADEVSRLLFGITEEDSGPALVTIGNSCASIPKDVSTESPAPTGDYTGVTFGGNGFELLGSISVVPVAADASALMDRILAEINGQTGSAPLPYSVTDLLSRQTVSAALLPTILASLEITTNSDLTTGTMRNDLISLIGTTTEPSAAVTDFPVSSGTSTNQFRIIIQATQNGTSEAVVLLGVVPSSAFATTGDSLTALVDGTNVGPNCLLPVLTTVNTNSPGAGTADFLFAVDNSGSMADEQTAVSDNALRFFDRLQTLGVDFRIGVVTSDNPNVMEGTGFTTDRTQFQSDIQAGITGLATESGIWQAEQAILNSVVVPRSGAAFSIIMVSDEADQYKRNENNNANPANAGGLNFNTTDNVFLNNSYKVYGIIGLDGTGAAGTCDGAVGKANNANNAYAPDDGRYNGNVGYFGYWQLAKDTGGAVSSICSNNYGAFLEQIADQTAASTGVALTSVPISTSLNVFVNGTLLVRTSNPATGETGYIYDGISNRISFTGTIPASGTPVVISYFRFAQ